MIKIQNEQNKLFVKYRDYDLMTTTLSMIGLLLAGFNYEMKIDTEDITPKTYRKSDKVYTMQHTNLFKLVILMSSLLSLGCMIMRTFYKQKLKMLLKSDSQSFSGVIDKIMAMNKGEKPKEERINFFH